jgi:hypothetical protein
LAAQIENDIQIDKNKEMLSKLKFASLKEGYLG